MPLTRPQLHQITDGTYKQPCRVVILDNITLSGGAPTTVDDVSLAVNDRVLVVGQVTKSQNGIYQVSTLGTGSNGTWVRTTDANATGELVSGALVVVQEGTEYEDTLWKLTTDGTIIIGTTPIEFAFEGAGSSGAAGADTEVLFNDTGVIGASSNFTFDKITQVLSLRTYNVPINYTGNTAPSNPHQGDEWYYPPTDTLYKYINDGSANVWVDLNSALYNANASAIANTLALRDSGANLVATNFIGVASSAKYADLAEKYIADGNYAPGTVVIFGGEQEITTSNITHDTRVAGVISTAPAYLMNSEITGAPVAFTGRVPCWVQGPVSKGDLLVNSTTPGVATKIDNSLYSPGCVIGKSLENLDNELKTIEIVVGRF